MVNIKDLPCGRSSIYRSLIIFLRLSDLDHAVRAIHVDECHLSLALVILELLFRAPAYLYLFFCHFLFLTLYTVLFKVA